MTGSRGPVVAFSVAIVIFALMKLGFLKSIAVFVVALTSIAIMPGGPLAESVRQMPLVRRLLEGSAVTDVTSGRSELFRAALDAMLTHPMGIGWGRYTDYTAVTEGVGGEIYVHNVILEVGAEAGWVGLTTFSILLLFVAFCCIKIWHLSHAALAVSGFAYWLGAAMFSSDFGGNRGLWLLVGVVLGVYSYGLRTRDPSGSVAQRQNKKRANL